MDRAKPIFGQSSTPMLDALLTKLDTECSGLVGTRFINQIRSVDFAKPKEKKKIMKEMLTQLKLKKLRKSE